MAKLTAGQLYALKKPPYGFCLGSNMWPLVSLRDKDGNEVCDGEDINELLRDGLLTAEKLDAPIFVEKGGADIPDNEMTHRLELTSAGRAALAKNVEG